MNNVTKLCDLKTSYRGTKSVETKGVTSEGELYEITTSKRYSGRIVSSMTFLTETEERDGVVIDTFEPYSEKNQSVQAYAHEATRATEKNLMYSHKEALNLYSGRIGYNPLTKTDDLPDAQDFLNNGYNGL